MADRIFRLDRRELVTGLGAAVLSPALPRIAAAQGRPSLMLQAKAGIVALRPGEANTPIWSLLGPAHERDMSLKRGDDLEITLANELPVAAALNWHGLDGVPAAEPLVARAPLSPGAKQTFVIPLRHAALLCATFASWGGQRPPGGHWSSESEPVAVTATRSF